MDIENKKIVVLDDEAIVCDFLEKILKNIGAKNIVTFTDENEFIKEINSEPKPDLIFIDHFLKEASGVDLITKHRIHLMVPPQSLILMSSDIDVLDDAYDLGIPAQILSKNELNINGINRLLDRIKEEGD